MIFKNIQLTSNLYKIVLRRNMSSADVDDVIFESIKKVGVITLNRPKVLNSLNLSMVSKIKPTLEKWENEKSIVIVKGSGEKAFCAGGDVKAIALAGLKGDKLGHNFFRIEYGMNCVIGQYKIPYVALIDGITMGGGVGLSVHGRYRVATERTLFAMPETQIALFPDVGTSYFLNTLSGKLGHYLAITGHRLKGSDVFKAGIATHYVESRNLASVYKDLLECNNDNDIKNVLHKYAPNDDHKFSLGPYMEEINKCFSASTIEGIIQLLKENNSEFAQNTLKAMAKMSPTSMKVSKTLLDRGINKTLPECLTLEYRVAVNTLANHEFYEGIRALLIDKDQNPKWKPAHIEEVTDEIVDRHFAKLPEAEEFKHKL